jgi:hypothetical protein
LTSVLIHLGYCRRCQANSIRRTAPAGLRDWLAVLALHRVYRCAECGHTRYRLARRRLRTALAVVVIVVAVLVLGSILRDQIKQMERHDPAPAKSQ